MYHYQNLKSINIKTNRIPIPGKPHQLITIRGLKKLLISVHLVGNFRSNERLENNVVSMQHNDHTDHGAFLWFLIQLIEYL